MDCKGLLVNQKSITAMTEPEILTYLSDHNIYLKTGESVLFPFCMLITQQEKRTDEKKIEYIRHKTALYKYDSLLKFEQLVEDSSAVFSQVTALFNDKQDIRGLETGKGYVIPCLLTLLEGTYNVRCVVLK